MNKDIIIEDVIIDEDKVCDYCPNKVYYENQFYYCSKGINIDTVPHYGSTDAEKFICTKCSLVY